MNIPLNIDWQQILLHLFNLGILAAGLWLLLYRPVKKYMDGRLKSYEDREAEAAGKLAEAEAAKRALEEQLAIADELIRQKNAEAAKAADEATRETMQEAQRMADQLLADTRRQAEEERREILAGAQDEVVELAAEAVKKLMLEQDAAYEAFASSFLGENENEDE